MLALLRFLSPLKKNLSLKPTNYVELFVNDKPVSVPQGSTILQACSVAGVDIPRFCYHHKLSIAGNCRMCLVEVEKSPKPIASCAMPAAPGMKVKTNSPMTKQAREGVLEFILANHPLDCPICDQAGECDLQDQSMTYGTDRSRMIDIKRAVEDKDIGPLVKTEMTRCIQCTRCVRFASEIAGVDTLGTVGRGSEIQIGTYIHKIIDSELSGNLIDICPVGALVSKPYSFKARPWELRRTESIDVMDAIGSNIVVCARTDEVLRILPRINEEINEDWIDDKARFSHDGLKYQRLVTPMARIYEDGELLPSDWATCLAKVAEKMKSCDPSEMAVLAGKFADLESLTVLKDLFNKFDCENLFTSESFPFSSDFRQSYCANAGVANVEESDLILMVGFNPRLTSPMLNCRIRKGIRNGDTRAYMVGSKVDLGYDYTYLGDSLSLLNDIASKNHALSKNITNARYPLVLLGSSALQNCEGSQILNITNKISQMMNHSAGFNLVHSNASQMGALDLGYKQAEKINKTKLLFLCGADEFDFTRKDLPQDCLVVYLGSHGDVGAQMADVVFPGAAYTEKTGTFVNTEGRYQECVKAVSPPGDAREDWQVVKALAEFVGVNLPYDTFGGVRGRMGSILPGMSQMGYRQETTAFHDVFVKLTAGGNLADRNVPESSMRKLSDYYMTDSISRNSPTMAKCVAEQRENEKRYEEFTLNY